jgi:glycine/D-amino acid oxidase-like deaminating enzyme
MTQRSFERVDSEALSGRHGVVFGAGPLGLFTALALARNGAQVSIVSADRIENGIGFVNAAGLYEPVASADPRAAQYLLRGMSFCEWARHDGAWGIEPRRVLFLSEDEAKVEQQWMVQLSSYKRATAEEIAGRRPYGAIFDTYVLQPNIAIDAIQRELAALGVHVALRPARVTTARLACNLALKRNADFFVMALGLGLAEIPDVEHVAGVNAMLSAGTGVTIVLPYADVGLDHVIMDDADLGYLIPQRTQVIGGGTNYVHEFDDPEALATTPDPADVELVWDKITRLWPAAAGVKGEARVGSRPLRAGGKLLTAFIEPPELSIPCVLLGGAGGSGWTFAVGIADDTVAAVTRYFSGGAEQAMPLVAPTRPDPSGSAEAAA